jgi:TRAP-type C4-dicarboxylate transport system substrate-binding protein
VVDAAIGTYQMLDAFNLYEVTCCHYDWNASVSPIYLVINKAKYQSLPADVKQVIDSFTGENAAVAMAHVWTLTTRDGKARAKSKEHKFGGITPQQQTELQKRFQSQTDARLEALEKRGLPAKALFKKIVDAIKAEEAK